MAFFDKLAPARAAKQASVSGDGSFDCTNTNLISYEDHFGWSTYCERHKGHRPEGSKKCAVNRDHRCKMSYRPFDSGIIVAGMDMPVLRGAHIDVHNKYGERVGGAIWLDLHLKKAKVIRGDLLASNSRPLAFDLVDATGWTVGPFYWKVCPDTDFFVVL